MQFYKLQILEGEKWAEQAKSQHRLFVTEPFKRGRFFANSALKKGHPEKSIPLVFDVKRYHIHIDSITIPRQWHKEIAMAIGNYFNLNDDERETICKQFDKRCRSRRLKRWIHETDKRRLEEWWYPYAKKNKIPRNGLYFVEDYHRSYPYGKLLGAVLQTVREERDVETNQALPTGGLEYFFNSYLQGKGGKRFLLRSPTQSFEDGCLLTSPEDGADIYLSIDQYIQAIAEEEIERAVKIARAKSGWAVMMNPSTGEVYALAQYPEFDPSDYKKFYNHSELIEATKVHAIADCFEPGSIMKPISIAIALLANIELAKQGKPPIFDPVDMIFVGNGTFPGRKQPIHDVGYHHYLNMYLAIQKSSNIYVAKLIQRVVHTLGDEWYRQQLEQIFGFGVPTGIELPYESVGFLPSLYKRYNSGRRQWSVPTPYSLAIGYNLLTNSMQLMRAFATIVNGGYAICPTLVKKIIKDDKVIFDFSQREKRQVLSAEIGRMVTYALKSVTKPGGRATSADVPGYTEACKTGTTEKIHGGTYSKRHHFSSFIGCSPAENPQFLLYVAINEPEYRFLPGIGKFHFGGKCAAPAFKYIMHRSLQYLGISPDDPHGYPKGDPRSDRTRADWSQQACILQNLYTQWNR